MSYDHITVEDLDAALTAICEANPDRVNPWDPTTQTCVYTDPNNGEHCLIGEYLANLGALPETAKEAAWDLMLDLGFATTVAVRANRWQKAADGVHHFGTSSYRPRWKHVVAIMKLDYGS